MKHNKKFIIILSSLLFFTTAAFNLEAQTLNTAIELSEIEQELVNASKQKAVKLGVMPNYYPMSERTSAGEFRGITIALAELLSKKTGLQFEYTEIPIGKMSPIEFLEADKADLVSGVIRAPDYLANPGLAVSERLIDATSAFVALSGKKILILLNLEM